jgi:hypothetical protein
MKGMIPMKTFASLLLLVATATTPHAAQVLGKRGSCAAVWDTGFATPTGSTLSCADGDPSCDADGAVNNQCAIAVSACADTPVGTCMPTPLTSLKFTKTIAKLVGFTPPTVGAPNCGAAGTATLLLRRRPANPKKPAKRFLASKPLRLLMRGKKGLVNPFTIRCVPPIIKPKCPLRTDDPAFPAEIDLTVPLEDPKHPEVGNGSDLDNGWTGVSHNFPVIGGSTLRYCLSGCDGRTTFACQASGSTAVGPEQNPVNLATFGAPLPLLAANVPVCVINRFRDPVITGTFNLQTGEAGAAGAPNLIRLFSDVYITSQQEVCPRCQVSGGQGSINSTGTCSSSAKSPGSSCTVDGAITVAGKGLYLLSSDCPPAGAPTASLDIQLPFTTGTTPPITGPLPCPDAQGPQTSDDACGAGVCNATCTGTACAAHDAAGNCIDAKGGISQLCCSNATATPCFPTKNGGSFTRTGTPGPPGKIMVNAAVFCIPRTGSTLINITSGLPGPGALLLPATVSVLPPQ